MKTHKTWPGKIWRSPASKSDELAARTETFNRRKWLFRLLALALPFVVLASVEMALRIGGYGYPASFFLKSRAGDRDVLIDNEKFGWRFFPPAMARTPRPFSIPAPKPPNTYRIFVLGESAAWGDPEPAVGFARMIEVMLRKRYPETRFEVVNAAMTAISSHAILPIARDCARHEGDLWLIYMGHNEVVGPFGPGTVFGAEMPSLPMIRANVAMKSTRVGQWLDDTRRRFAEPQSRTQSWGGMQMFLDKQIAANDPRLEKVYAHFERNLQDILRIGSRKRVRQIVCTAGSNLKDCPPFASQQGVRFNPATQAQWEKLFASGVAAEAANRLAEATNFYSQAAQLDSAFAELHFRLGLCLAALARYNDARHSFKTARDLDTLRFRADSRIAQIIQRNAANRANDGIYLLDAGAALATNSPSGIPGDSFFYEHVHLTFEGNYVIARAAVEQIARLLPQRITNSATSKTWLSLDECARRLVWTDWNRHRVLEDIHRRLLDPPFTNQLGWLERNARREKQLAELSAARVTNTFQAAQQYAGAVALNPDDWVLREKFGEALHDLGFTREAIQQWEQVIRVLPHRAATYNNLGNLFNSIGASAEAKKHFSEALRRMPDMVEALNGMGLALANEQKLAEAIDFYTRALRAKPDFVAARVNLGIVLATQGKTAEAIGHYAEALRLKPDNGMAHANLAKLLVSQGKQSEAMRHFSEAARLMPNNAAARFNLGNALAAQNQEAEAAEEYAAAVRLDPNFADARVNLGTILVRHGQFAEGAAQLAEAVRLNPNSAQAHLGLGVALEGQGKLSEAITHYREALRIDPTNASAKRHLESATAR